ncbi:M3 family metallopeptidase [Nereida ignava]|uniref:M3 family metallopeptidase n=1 Tax=Nereida ignava TaxID=282199 RepID=UPI003F6AE47D
MTALTIWTEPFDMPAFSKVRDDMFAPAFEAALAEACADVAAIAADPAPATFENTVEAMARAGEDLDKVLSIFYTISGAVSNNTREALSRDFSPALADYSSEISLNADLFARYQALWDQRDNLDLTAEQASVLDLSYKNYVRAGALLEGDDRARYAQIKSRLASLGTAFGQNLLSDERTWVMELTQADLDGLPEFAVDAMRAAAQEKGVDGPVVTLARSIITPFLQFCSNRDLRKAAYEAYVARGANGGETDNRALANEMLSLRHELAQLLGYKDYAAYKLEVEMAGDADAVRSLLMDVWAPAKAAADADAIVLEQMLVADGHAGPIQAWDWHYYAEARRKAEHDLDEAELKPYLQLDRMIEAAFSCASRLFDLSFEPVELDLYHEDCRAWNVTRNGAHIAVFVGDYFARGSKRSGAWCSAMRAQNRMDKEVRPVVLNVCNFAKPSGGPALLSYDDARTLFHEFGHALHQMLSDVTYEMVSGTSVPRDFVELPSQLYEHWMEVPEVFETFATHAITGAAMPADLRERLLGASTYNMGFQTVEYVASALVDLDFHDGPPPADAMQAQAETLDRIGMPAAICMRHATPHFAHVFAGGYYAASYYSYMWSEVMDADAFEAFEDAGSAFDSKTAKALEEHILSKGGSVDPKDLYIAFRGRLPGVQALLKGRGLAA